MISVCHFHQQHRANSGFTLIEVLVITSLTIIILLSITTLFMTFLINQVSLTRKQAVKIAGDNALKQIEQTLRGMKGIDDSDCTTGATQISVYDFTNTYSQYSEENDRIASSSGEDVYYLTPEDVAVENLTIDCYSGQDRELVRFNFTLNDSTDLNFGDTISQDFATSISIRN